MSPMRSQKDLKNREKNKLSDTGHACPPKLKCRQDSQIAVLMGGKVNNDI